MFFSHFLCRFPGSCRVHLHDLGPACHILAISMTTPHGETVLTGTATTAPNPSPVSTLPTTVQENLFLSQQNSDHFSPRLKLFQSVSLFVLEIESMFPASGDLTLAHPPALSPFPLSLPTGSLTDFSYFSPTAAHAQRVSCSSPCRALHPTLLCSCHPPISASVPTSSQERGFSALHGVHEHCLVFPAR